MFYRSKYMTIQCRFSATSGTINIKGNTAVTFNHSFNSFYYYLNFINPATFDLFFSIKLLIMIALGGMHNLWGAVIGAGIITFLNYEWLHYFEEFEVIVYGAILLVVVIFLPDGLAGIPDILKKRLGKH